MKDNIKNKIETLTEVQLKETEKFIENITKQSELPEVLQKKLESIKNNPIEEPKIAIKREDVVLKLSTGGLSTIDAALEILDAVYTIEEIEAIELEHKLEIKDLVMFGNEIALKVFGKQEIVDGVEVYKEIASHSKLKPVPYSKKRQVRDAFSKVNEVSQKSLKALRAYGEKTNEQLTKKEKAEIEELEAKLMAAKKTLEEKINEAHDLDTSDMSEWEKELLHDKIIANCFGNYTPPMGKK